MNIKKEWKNIIKFAKVNYLIKGMGRVPQTLFFEILNENSIFYIFFYVVKLVILFKLKSVWRPCFDSGF